MKTLKMNILEYILAIFNIVLGIISIYSIKGDSLNIKIPQTTKRNDTNSLKNDWVMVGKDIKTALYKAGAEQNG